MYPLPRRSDSLVLTGVIIEVPGVTRGDSRALADSVDFDAKPGTLLGVILLELQSPVEFPQGLVGSYVARGNVDGLELLGKFVYYQAELVESIGRVCTAVIDEMQIGQQLRKSVTGHGVGEKRGLKYWVSRPVRLQLWFRHQTHDDDHGQEH